MLNIATWIQFKYLPLHLTDWDRDDFSGFGVFVLAPGIGIKL